MDNQTENRIREEWRGNLNTALEIFKVAPDAVSKKQITMLVESFIDELLKSQREELVEKIKNYKPHIGEDGLLIRKGLLDYLSPNKENK